MSILFDCQLEVSITFCFGPSAEYRLTCDLIDLSICPGNVAANTHSTALAVGEKAASIIAKALGIPYSLRDSSLDNTARL